MQRAEISVPLALSMTNASGETLEELIDGEFSHYLSQTFDETRINENQTDRSVIIDRSYTKESGKDKATEPNSARLLHNAPAAQQRLQPGLFNRLASSAVDFFITSEVNNINMA